MSHADFDQNGLAIAQSLSMETVDLNKSSVECQPFDLVVLSQVLEHIEQPQALLEDISSQLSKNNFLFIDVPNLYGFLMSDNTHLTTFTKKSLHLILESSGFKIVESGYGRTPAISARYGYYYSNPNETIYALACVDSNSTTCVTNSNSSLRLWKWKLHLDLAYTRLTLLYLIPNVLRPILALSTRFIFMSVSSIFSVGPFKAVVYTLKKLVKMVQK